MPISSEEKAAALARVPLFAGLSEASMERLAAATGEVTFAAGQFIIRQGQIGSGLYVIVAGSAKVISGSRQLARLDEGDFVGELSVIDQQPRLASVQAIENTTCLALASWDLLELLKSDSALSLNLIRGLAGRLRAVTEQQRH